MQHARTLIVVLFLAILAVAGFWMLCADDTSPVAPSAGANTAQAGGDGGDSAAADAAQGGVDAGNETTARVAAPPLDAGAGAAATGPGIVGQVLDERQNAIAGAVVTCTPGFGADFDNFEEFDFESALDGDVWRERLANSRRDRTETTTDREGRFRLAAGGKGSNLQLRVRAPSHVVLDKGVPRPVGKDADLGVLTLKSGATVSGRVLDRAGNPVVGARVSREAAGNGGGWGGMELPGFDEFADTMEPDSAATDAEGRFALLYCAAGKFALRARHVDHPSARLDGLAVEPGATLADVLIVAEPGASIRGRIVGVPEGSKPLRVLASLKPAEGANEPGGAVLWSPLGDASEMFADAGMGFGEKQVRSNADFTFELRGLQVGKTYRIWAAQSGRGFAGNAACTGRSEAASGTAGLELRYEPGISVTFQVVAAGTGAPIEKLWVRDQLRGGGGSGMADFMAYMPRSGRAKVYPEGKVTIANLRPKPKQTLSLTIEALGFQTLERKDIALPVTGAHDLGIVRLEPAPVLQVTVTGGPERRAVAGASVRVTAADRGDKSREQPFGQFDGIVLPGGGIAGVGATRSAKTDREGRCTMNALPGSAMVVSVTSKEFAPYASEPITLPAGEGGSHEVALVRGGSVEVTVVDSAGAVLKEARVEHAPPAGNRSSKQTNQDGVALFEHLSPGEHRFRLETQGGGSDFGPDITFGGEDRKPADEPGWQPLAVEDGGKATLRIAKDPMASLRGIVRENGLPLAGARVSFVEGAGEPAAQGEAATLFAGALEDFGGGGGKHSARTGDDGTYKLEDLPAGAHRLRITAKGRVSPTQVILALRQGENVVDVDLDVTIVRGTVRDGAGKPVAGASVSIAAAAAGSKVGEVDVGAMFEGLAGLEAAGFGGRSSVKTGDDGRYELRGVQAGKPLQVRAAAKGHAAAKSAVVEVPQGTARDGVDIQLGAAGRIKVTVADAPAFATVQATLLGAGGEPDAAVGPVMQMMRRGAVTLDGLRPGKWKVTLTTPGGATHEPRLVDVIAGETATLAF